ncbi:hypothetical protein H8356DRAFT_1312164 [Neocallimastix lanati (nom. inval.)]|nr:hypothetical protein H8356DRAFT_1312164 [Neocallimastix sp. JGI-2020a]
MLSNKLLIVVGLLFLGNLTSSAVVEDLVDCSTAMSDWNEGSPTPCTGSTIASCCIEGNKLYKINSGDTTCGGEETLSAGIHVINKAGTNSGELTLGSGDYTDNLSNILLYICNSSTCTRTYGYIKDASNYYSILLNGNTKLADGNAITTPTGTYSTTCSSNKGKLIKPTDPGSTVYLCLTDDFGIAFPGDSITSANYLMDKVNTVTSDDKTYNEKVVITTDDYAVAFNNLYESGENTINEVLEDCYDSTSGKIMASNDNICNGENCASYYKCTEGLCELSTETVIPRSTENTPKCVTEEAATAANSKCEGKLDAGYYYYSVADTNIGAEATTLYTCPGSGYCEKVDRPIGYYVNALTTGASDAYLACSRGGTEGSYTYSCATTSNNNGSSCSAAGLYTNTNLFLCTSNTGNGIQLDASSSYLVSVASNFLGIVKAANFVVIKVDASKNITVQQYKDDGKSEDGVRYKYTNKDDESNKIIIRTDTASKNAICNENISKMSEFKRNFAANHDTTDDSIIGKDYVEYFEAVTRKAN